MFLWKMCIRDRSRYADKEYEHIIQDFKAAGELCGSEKILASER